MNTLVKQTFAVGVLSSMFIAPSFAQPSEQPDQFVKRVADSFIERLKADKEKLKTNPNHVKVIVRENIDPYIDAQGFARTVMGRYATQQYSTPAQRAAFTKTFREELINSYGSALAKYTNQTYKLRKYTPPAEGKSPTVTLDFINNADKIPVTFYLVEQKDQWKIRNLSVAGVNLGVQFHNQFAATMQRHGNDFDKAAANFSPDAEKK